MEWLFQENDHEKLFFWDKKYYDWKFVRKNSFEEDFA
jgi:hypothetical protein